MEKHLKKLPEEILSLIYRARDISRELDMPAFLVGGFVRDLIIAVKDYDLDIAVEGQGIVFAERFSSGLDCRLVTHTRFGTAAVQCLQPHGRRFKIDFASARKEMYPSPAALPVVSPGSLKDDLFRRDFTINTLAIGLAGDSWGRLIDAFKGREDLAAGIVRVLHDNSFIDDPTRILRAVRFEQRLGFRIEPHTLRLLKGAVSRGMLGRVQPQRLRDEFVRMLKEEFPERALLRVRELAGFDFLSPRITLRRNTAQLFGRIREEATWFREQCLPHRHVDVWVMYMAALFSGLERDEASAVCRRFGLGRGETSRILAYVQWRPEAERILSMAKIRPARLFRLLEPLPYEVILLIRAASASAAVKRHIGDFFNGFHGTCVSVSGHDLQRIGIDPGPEYQRIFRRLLDAKLNGTVKTRDDELAFVARMRSSVTSDNHRKG